MIVSDQTLQKSVLINDRSRNAFLNMISYVCHVFALPISCIATRDGRPHVRVELNGLNVNFLVDSGASVSCIAESIYEQINGYLSLQTAPVPEGISISAASGHNMGLVGCFMFNLRILGRHFYRPLYVIRGLARTMAILGIDFIREQQMVIDADHVFFKSLPKNEQFQCATLRASRDFGVSPRTVMRIDLSVSNALGTPLDPGIFGVSGSAFDQVGVWDTLNEVDRYGTVCTVVTNTSSEEVIFRRGEIVGFFSPLSDNAMRQGLSEAKIDAIFNDFSKEPKEPHKGPALEDLSEEGRKYLNENLNIQAPSFYFDRYADLCLKYHDVFSKSKFDLGRTDVVEHKVTLRSEEPIHVRQFRIPLEHRQTIYDWVDELLSKGAIEVSRSCFNSPIFLVPKPHGHGMRAVLDFRQVNNASVPDRYVIREVRDCVDEIGLARSTLFSTIDLTSGFWQQSLEESSRQYTAFTVPGKGTRYQWTVTPMGLQGSPASFARLIDYMMRGLKNVLTYIDDVLVHSPSHTDQLVQLENVFLRLRKYNLKLNVTKSTFGADEVSYLGYIIDARGVRPGTEKLNAVKRFPIPNSVKKIREFVGLANYFRFLIPRFSFFAGLLTNLTKKTSGYVDGDLPAPAKNAFLYLQAQLVAEPIVAHPRPGCTYHLSTDAAAGDEDNPGGFGAVLTQIWEDKSEHVIAYASRSLKANEENYSAYLLELAAAAWAIDHFSVYLQGRHFELFTDHKPLETLSKIHKKTLNRLQEQMLEYTFKINYRKGLDNTVADALSRNVAMIDGDATDFFINTMSDDSGDIIIAQKEDAFVSDVRKFLDKGILPDHSLGYRAKVEKTSKDCFVDRDIVWIILRRPGRRTHSVLLCPERLRNIVMDVAHGGPDGGHSGKQRTVDKLELAYWWPGITYDVDTFISKCIRCQEMAGRKPAPSPLKSLPICEEPNYRVHMDLFGPLKVRSAGGKKYIIVMTDAFTKYTELAAISDKTAVTVARAFFEHWICRHGVPAVIISDRGKEFINKVMIDLCDFMGITHTATSSYHPQSNSEAETYNKTMIRYLSGMLDNKHTLDWEELLPAMMFCYNTHVQRATLESPFFLTYLHSPRLPYFNLEKPRPLYRDDYLGHAFTNMRLSFRQVRDNLEDARKAREQYFNRRTKERSFRVGEQVLVKFPKIPLGVNPKFFKQWKGPYRVTKVLSKLNVKVQAGTTGKKIVVHVDRVRHMRLEDEEEAFCSNQGSLHLDQPNRVQEFRDIKNDGDICENPDDKIDDGAVKFYSAEENVHFFPESDTEDEDEEKADNNLKPETPVLAPPAPPAASSPVRPPLPTADSAASYSGRVTRTIARERKFDIEDHPLPAHCPTSKRFVNASGK